MDEIVEKMVVAVAVADVVKSGRSRCLRQW
jgi:hypothetical protein